MTSIISSTQARRTLDRSLLLFGKRNRNGWLIRLAGSQQDILILDDQRAALVTARQRMTDEEIKARAEAAAQAIEAFHLEMEREAMAAEAMEAEALQELAAIQEGKATMIAVTKPAPAPFDHGVPVVLVRGRKRPPAEPKARRLKA